MKNVMALQMYLDGSKSTSLLSQLKAKVADLKARGANEDDCEHKSESLIQEVEASAARAISLKKKVQGCKADSFSAIEKEVWGTRC